MYELVNPLILNKKYNSSRSDSMEAGEEIWSKFSKDFVKKSTDNFYYTLQKKDKLYHFKVEENTENNQVEYNITQLNKHYKDDDDREILKLIKDDATKLSGGKHKSSSSSSSISSSSSSTSESDYYTIKRKINNMNPSIVNYYPGLYSTLYNIKTISVPHLITTNLPYNIRINFPNFQRVVTVTTDFPASE